VEGVAPAAEAGVTSLGQARYGTAISGAHPAP